MSTRVTARDHLGRADLPALPDFGSRSLRARFPANAFWHPGDFVWQLKDTGDVPLSARLWETPDGIAAVAFFVGPDQLWVEVLPDAEELLEAALDWAEDRLSAQDARSGEAALSVRLSESDVGRVALLEARGYRRSAPEGVRFRRALSCDIAPAPIPDGVRIRDCSGVDPEARAACHRNAWSNLDHIGIQNARSSFTAQTYERLLASPVYDPSLDILAETVSGELVANCICWADSRSGVGTFEPVGTHVDYRGQGWARAVNVEGLRRLKARGLTWARVGTAHFNAPAIATYLSCGFEIIDRTALWTRHLS